LGRRVEGSSRLGGILCSTSPQHERLAAQASACPPRWPGGVLLHLPTPPPDTPPQPLCGAAGQRVLPDGPLRLCSLLQDASLCDLVANSSTPAFLWAPTYL
jgi:hypothetical protein